MTSGALTVLVGINVFALATTITMFSIAIHVTRKAKRDVDTAKAKAAACAQELKIFLGRIQDITFH